MKIIYALCLAMAIPAVANAQDWANYGRYEADNQALSKAPEVVFMGDSTTDGWDDAHPEFFTGNNFACRGISGQVTSQMLCRFQADVVALRPKIVVILCGINDIALNNGHIETNHTVENIKSMAQLAVANGIIPIICSITPTNHFFWRSDVDDIAPKVITLRDATEKMAYDDGYRYVDYYSAMVVGDGEIDPRYSDDRLHPNRAGYDVMEPIILSAIAAARQ